MPITRVTLAVPATGEGAPSDVSFLIGRKTVVLTGRFRGIYELLASQDGSSYVPIAQFDAGGAEEIQQTVSGAFSSFRVRVATPDTVALGAVTCEVSAIQAAGENHFATVATLGPTFQGVTTPIDLAVAFPPTGPEDDIVLLCRGDLTGLLAVAGSLDGSHFAPLGSFRVDRRPQGGPAVLELPALPTSDKIRYVALALSGTIGASGVVVTIGGRSPAASSSADWPIDQVGYFMLDPVGGNDANPGVIVAPPGTVFTPAQVAATAIKTTDRLEQVRPTNGNGRMAVTLIKPKPGLGTIDRAVAGDGRGREDRSALYDYSLFITRGSDLTNSGADRAQLAGATVVGPYEVQSYAAAPDPVITCTVNVAGLPLNLPKFRLRIVTSTGATFYAPIRGGDLTGASDLKKITLWDMPFPASAGDHVYVELPGVVLHDFIEMTEAATTTPGGSFPRGVTLAGIQVGNSAQSVTRLGARLSDQQIPSYAFIRVGDLGSSSIVGDMGANRTYVDEEGLTRDGGYGLCHLGGLGAQGDYEVALAFSYLGPLTVLQVSLTAIQQSHLDDILVKSSPELCSIDHVDYGTIRLNPMGSSYQVAGCRWDFSVADALGLVVEPLAGSSNPMAGQVNVSDLSSVYPLVPQPSQPGIILHHGYYVVRLDHGDAAAPAIDVGTGVQVLHDDASTKDTVVTYESLRATGFEIEGAQKVICRLNGLGLFGGNDLPCPRGIVMRLYPLGPGSVALPVGLMVTGYEAVFGDRVFLASAASVLSMNIIGYTVTNAIQGADASHDGWVVVSDDPIGVLRIDPASAIPLPNTKIYLTDAAADQGTFTRVPARYVNGVGSTMPIGPGVSGAGPNFVCHFEPNVVPANWYDEQGVRMQAFDYRIRGRRDYNAEDILQMNTSAQMTWDSALSGGAVQESGPLAVNNGNALPNLLGQAWGLAFRAKMPPVAPGIYNIFGMQVISGDEWYIASSHGAAVITNFALTWNGGAFPYLETNHPVDTNLHDFLVMFSADRDELVVFIDGQLSLTTTGADKLSNAAHLVAMYFPNPGFDLCQYAFGYQP